MNIEDMSIAEIDAYVRKRKVESRDESLRQAETQCAHIKKELVGKFFKHKDAFGEEIYYYIVDAPEVKINRMGDIWFTPHKIPALKITTAYINDTPYPAVEDDELYCLAGESASPLNYLINECEYTQVTAKEFVEEYSKRLFEFFNRQKEN